MMMIMMKIIWPLLEFKKYEKSLGKFKIGKFKNHWQCKQRLFNTFYKKLAPVYIYIVILIQNMHMIIVNILIIKLM